MKKELLVRTVQLAIFQLIGDCINVSSESRGKAKEEAYEIFHGLDEEHKKLINDLYGIDELWLENKFNWYN